MGLLNCGGYALGAPLGVATKVRLVHESKAVARPCLGILLGARLSLRLVVLAELVQEAFTQVVTATTCTLVGLAVANPL